MNEKKEKLLKFMRQVAYYQVSEDGLNIYIDYDNSVDDDDDSEDYDFSDDETGLDD